MKIPDEAFLIQDTVFAAPIPCGLPWADKRWHAAYRSTYPLSFDLLPGRWLPALERWIMAVPCRSTETISQITSLAFWIWTFPRK